MSQTQERVGATNTEGFQEVRRRRAPYQGGERAPYQGGERPSYQGGQRVERQERPNRKDVLDKVAAGDLNPDEAEKMLRTRKPPRFVVTRTGAVALYNLQRNPIVLYADQWERLSNLIRRDILDKYMERNKNVVKRRQPRNDAEAQAVPQEGGNGDVDGGEE